MSGSLSPLFTWRSAVVESDLPPTSKLVALALSLHMNERGGSCFPSQATLGRETSLHPRTVREHLAELEQAGWIERTKRAGTSDLVTAIDPGRTTRGALGQGRKDAPATPGPRPAEGVTRASEETVAIAPVSPARAPDVIWDALVAELGYPGTRNERSKRNGVVRQLREVNATPSLIAERCAEYRRRWPGIDLTDTALVNQWTLLGTVGPQVRRGVSPADVLRGGEAA